MATFAYLHGLSSQPLSDAGVRLSLKDLQNTKL